LNLTVTMNRLQKKCFAATAGFHLLLVVVLLTGAAFFTLRPQVDTSQPGAAPIVIYSDPASSEPPAVKAPDTSPVTSAPKNSATPVAPVNAAPLPDGKINLVRVTRNVPQPPAMEHRDVAVHNPLRETYGQVLDELNRQLTTSTLVKIPGPGVEAATKYADTVKRHYEAAWLLPEDSTSDAANTKVSVTIGRDGSVISSRILDRSGDSKVDASVQRTLDRVTFVVPFPDGAKEKERTFIINFNLKAKRLLG